MLTDQQLAALKADIISQIDPTLVGYRAAGATGQIADWYNQNLSSFVVWQTAVDINVIFDNIVWANLTPVDSPDGTATWTNRSLCCQGKQFNIQTILAGRGSINSAKANIRAGLQDALTAIPSGSGGASQNAGWTSVRSAMQRFATNGEKIFATGTGTAVTPGFLVVEGILSYEDVTTAFYLP